MVFQNKVPWEIAEGVGLCLSILFIYKWIHLVLQPKWQKIQLAQYKLMERLNSYIWIKGNIRVNVIITTLQRNEWVMKKKQHKKTQHEHMTTRPLKRCCSWLRLHWIFMLYVCVVVSQWWCTVMYQLLGRWSSRSNADQRLSPNRTDNAQTSWPLSWKLHFSSINEDLLLYWLMVHFSSAGLKSMSATRSLKTEGWGVMPVIPTLLNTPELTHK